MTKACPKCEETKPLDCFYVMKSRDGKKRFNSYCKECSREIGARRYAEKTGGVYRTKEEKRRIKADKENAKRIARKAREAAVREQLKTKVCRSCGKEKTKDDFYTSGRRKSGSVKLDSFCKPCSNIRRAKQLAEKNGNEYRTLDEIRAAKKPPKPKSEAYMQRLEWERRGVAQQAARAISELTRIKTKRRDHDNRHEKRWEIAVAFRIESNKHRKKQREAVVSKIGGIDAAIKRVQQRRAWHELDPWTKKLTNKLSNLKARRNRKNVRNEHQEGKGRKHLGETVCVEVQVCFDWMAA